MPRTPTTLLLLLLLVSSVVGLAITPLAAADYPMVTESPGATRTVTWNLSSAQGLSLTNASLVSGHAELRWIPRNVSWDTSDDFLSNGTLGPTLAEDSSGIAMRADDRNHVSNPGFANPDVGGDGWTYVNGSAGELEAGRDGQAELGWFRYASPSTQQPWDGMDSISGWQCAAVGSVGCGYGVNTTEKKEGTGSIEVNLALDGAGHSGLQQMLGSPIVNWSEVDQLVLWVYLNTSAALAFNMSALDADLVTHFTAPQPLLQDWQELTVDLTQFGNASTRARLVQVSLWVWGSGTLERSILFDDIRVGAAKSFTDAAVISQTIHKANATTDLPGSAALAFSWSVQDATGVSYTTRVSVSGPGGAYEQSLSAGSFGSWNTFAEDLSRFTSAIGDYALNVTVTASVNTTAACNLTVDLDDVSLRFPNHRNGTYLSRSVDLATEAEFLEVAWDAELPSETSALLSLRSGSNVNPGSPGWSPWQAWSAPGLSPISLPGARFFQVRVDLNTTNSSRSPAFSSVTVSTRHRSPGGILVSDLFTAPPEFLRWKTIAVEGTSTSASSISMSIGDGTYYTPVASGANLSLFAGRTIRWQANLTTANGLETPTLVRIQLIYEYLGPIVRLTVSASQPLDSLKVGEWVHLQAATYDPGGHVNTSGYVTWWTNDPAQDIFNNDTRRGAYLPSKAGDWILTAILQGSGVFATLPVHVENITDQGVTPGVPASWVLSPGFLIPLAALAVAGFGAYEFAIRRMFAVDDVFVISRDGRLMLHNTRRMRADRDEDVLSGMLTAMIAFLRDWDPEENGTAKRFDYGNKTALLAHGDHVFVAAVYSGRVPHWASKDLGRFVRNLETRFGPTFAHWNGSPQDLHGLREFTEGFVSRVRYRENGLRSPRGA
jgi:hypothetical protein